MSSRRPAHIPSTSTQRRMPLHEALAQLTPAERVRVGMDLIRDGLLAWMEAAARCHNDGVSPEAVSQEGEPALLTFAQFAAKHAQTHSTWMLRAMIARGELPVVQRGKGCKVWIPANALDPTVKHH